MTLGVDDLVFCAGSRLEASFREVVETAAAGRFKGISIWPVQLERDRAAGWTPDDMRDHLARHGVEVVEVEPMLSWLPLSQLPDFAREMARARMPTSIASPISSRCRGS